MTSRQQEIKALKAGERLPSHRVVQLRSMGMHSIRYEFVVRLLRSSLRLDTLSIYWEQGTEFMLKPDLESAPRRLVLGRKSSPRAWCTSTARAATARSSRSTAARSRKT